MAQRKAKLKEVIVWSGRLIDRTVWHFNSGKRDRYGEEGGAKQHFKLNGEHIVEVVCRQGSSCDAIQFVTNTGRRSQWYGGPGGNQQVFRVRHGHEVVGLNVSGGRCPSINSLIERPIKKKNKPNHNRPANHTAEATHRAPPNARVTRVVVWSGGLVDKTVFHYGNDEKRAYGQAGGARAVFDIHHSEFITEVHARMGEKTDQIRLKTNTGRMSQSFGGNGGSPVVYKAGHNKQIVGLRVAQGPCPKILGVIERPAHHHGGKPHHGGQHHHGGKPHHGGQHHKPVAEAVAGVISGMGQIFGGNTVQPHQQNVTAGRRITQIEIYAGAMIDRIHIYYDQGPPFMSGLREGGNRMPSFVMNMGELLSGLNTFQNHQNCNAVQFVTSHGRVSQWYGKMEGTPQNFMANPGMSIVGIQSANTRCPKIVGVQQGMIQGTQPAYQPPPQQNTYNPNQPAYPPVNQPTYQPAYQPPHGQHHAMPGGNWVQSARGQRMDGNILKCELRNQHGHWVAASVMARPGQAFENRNGKFHLMRN